MAVRSGSIYKTCYCRDGSGRRLGARCSRLKLASGAWTSGHGVWAFRIELPRAPGGRRRILRRVSNTRPGTRADMAAELARVCELLSPADGDEALADEIAGVLMACKRGRPLPDPRQLARRLRSGVPNASSITVGQYLTWWVAHRNIDEHTRLGYASHVRVHLDPHLGHLPLALLNSTHVEAMFATIIRRNRQILDDRASTDPARAGAATATRLTTPATIARVRATLRKALNDAMAKHRLIDFNPAVHAELPAYDPPTVRVWTERAITQWKAGGIAPSAVMVWTREQAGVFLDHAQRHDPPLYPVFLLILLDGPRRGEAVGVRTDQIDFDDRTATFSHQLTQHGYQPVYKKVKTRSGDRVIFLDSGTVDDLGAYWELRESWRIAAGARWPRTVTVLTPVPGGYTPIEVDLFFRQPDGRAWHPDTVTDRFQRDAAAAGLPPIRLHGGRHSAATYMKAAGADLLDMRKKLGHASVTVTADIYPASLDDIDRMVAERTAALIPATDRSVRGPTPAPPGRTVPERSHRSPTPRNGQKIRSRRRRMRHHLRIPWHPASTRPEPYRGRDAAATDTPGTDGERSGSLCRDGPLAQLVEQRTFNPQRASLSPLLNVKHFSSGLLPASPGRGRGVSAGQGDNNSL